MTWNNPQGADMWSFGYTDYFALDGPEDVFWGEMSRFDTAIAELYDNVEKMAVESDLYEKDWYDQILEEIRTFRDDPAYQNDPDQWEDQEFHALNGAITFYVVES